MGIVRVLCQNTDDGQFSVRDGLVDIVSIVVVGAESHIVPILVQDVVCPRSEGSGFFKAYVFNADQGTLVVQEVFFDFGEAQGVHMKGAAAFGNVQGLGRQEFQKVVVNAHRPGQTFNYVTCLDIGKAVVFGAVNQDGSSVGHVGVLYPDAAVVTVLMGYDHITAKTVGLVFIHACIIFVEGG